MKMMFWKSKESYMVFNKLNIRQIILVLIAVVIMGGVLIGKIIHKDVDTYTESSFPMAINASSRVTASEGSDFKVVGMLKPVTMNDNDAILKKMTEQMEKDREQQRRIKNLKMQREETDLELEEQKALSELNKFKKDSIGSVNRENSVDDSNMDIKIVYLGGVEAQKEAILSINGTNYSVKNKDRPLKNIEVLSIANNDVTIRFLTPLNTTTVYQFKSE